MRFVDQMSDDTMSEVLGNQNPTASTESDFVAKPSRRARNDQKWDSLKDEIYSIYITENSTLHNTKRAIEEQRGFKASERKWKEKLKEWNFDKKISARDMNILVAKAEKRVREDGKETTFFHGGSQITKERIDQFKRRKTTKDIEAPLPSAEIPKNITYHTPPQESSEPPQPAENIRQSSFKPNECATSSSSLPWSEADSAFHINKRNGRLSTVLEVSENGSSEDAISSLGTAKTLYPSNTDPNVDPGTLFPDVLNAADHLFAQDSPVQTPQLETDTSRTMERYNSSPKTSTSSFFDSPNVDKSLIKLRESLNKLSIDFSKAFAFDVSIPSPKESIPQKAAQIEIIHEEVLQDRVQEKVNYPLFADTNSRSGGDHRPISSTRSEDANSENGSSSSCEYDLKIFQVSTSSSTAIPASSAAALKKGLELQAQSVPTNEILQILVDEGNVSCLEFCRNLSRVCHLFGREGLFEEFLLAVDLIHDGCSRILGDFRKEATRCLVLKARVLKKMKNYIDSEATYRRVFTGLRELGDNKSLLKCQLGLSSLLKSIDRTQDALYFLLEVLMEHFTISRTSQERRRVIGLLHCIRSLHCKMELGENLTEMNESLLRLEGIQSRPASQQKARLALYVELARLGWQYSKFGMSNLGELCLRYPPPNEAGTLSPQTRIQLCLFYKERCLYAKQEGNVDQSISHLRAALVNISLLISETSAERSEEFRGQLDELVASFQQVLFDIKPPLTSPVDNLLLWKKAEAAYRALRTDPWIAQEKIASNDNMEHAMTHQGESLSISSGGSSMWSSGSSRYGVTYSVGSASSIVSNSAFMVP